MANEAARTNYPKTAIVLDIPVTHVGAKAFSDDVYVVINTNVDRYSAQNGFSEGRKPTIFSYFSVGHDLQTFYRNVLLQEFG